MAENDSQNGGLTKAAELLIVALLHKPTIKEAAAEVGISERTAFRWLQNPEFQTRYTEARRAATSDAVRELQGKALQAAETLARNLTCGNPFAENAAANAILSHSLKAIEQEEIMERVKGLEEAMRGQNKWRA